MCVCVFCFFFNESSTTEIYTYLTPSFPTRRSSDLRDISALPIAERDFGIVFQSYALFPNLTIERNVAFGLENSGRSKAEIAARVSELLDLVGLADQRRKYPAQLSGGQDRKSTRLNSSH